MNVAELRARLAAPLPPRPTVHGTVIVENPPAMGAALIGDDGWTTAALREAQEEVGLDPSLVEIAGRLGDYATGTGYRITPVLGLLPEGVELADLRLTPSPDEVEHVFALPMSVLLDPDAPQKRRAYYRGRWREFWVWPHPDHYVWGATAAILYHLAERLRGA